MNKHLDNVCIMQKYNDSEKVLELREKFRESEAFIKKAVNCHDDLVIACQDALSHLFQEIEAVIDEDLKTEYQRVIDVLQQAILKSESEN